MALAARRRFKLCIPAAAAVSETSSREGGDRIRTPGERKPQQREGREGRDFCHHFASRYLRFLSDYFDNQGFGNRNNLNSGPPAGVGSSQIHDQRRNIKLINRWCHFTIMAPRFAIDLCYCVGLDSLHGSKHVQQTEIVPISYLTVTSFLIRGRNN